MAPTRSASDVLCFDDIIDGYFPLEVSIADLMTRRAWTWAQLRLSHAPIMHIPALPPQDPVPLNISAGRAGMIDQMLLWVALTKQGCTICGTARWRWFDDTHTGEVFDPKTRLAEPAYLQGTVFLTREDFDAERPKSPTISYAL